MSTTLTVKAIEKSTYVITAAFTDEDGSAVIPATTVSWTLTDSAGNVISTGTKPAAASIDIVLSDTDLAITESASSIARFFTIETTYNSALGAGLTIKGSAKFVIENLIAVT